MIKFYGLDISMLSLYKRGKLGYTGLTNLGFASNSKQGPCSHQSPSYP